MNALALSPYSVGQINQVLFFLAVGLYLFHFKTKSSATSLMGWFFTSLSVGAAAAWFIGLIPGKQSIAIDMQLAFLLVSMIAIVQLVYLFPGYLQATTFERGFALFFVVCLSVYGLLSALSALFSFPISLLSYNTIETFVLPAFLSASFVWVISVLVRQIHNASVGQNRHLIHGESAARTLAFGLLFFWLLYFSAELVRNFQFGRLYYAFWWSSGILGAGGLLALIYLNYAPESMSLVAKLSAICLLIPSIALGWVGLIYPPSISLMGIALLTNVFVLFLLPWFFRHSIIRPLYTLIESIQRVNEGDWSISTSIEYRDEIGYLAESYNGMVSRVMIAANALKQANLSLEQKVQDQQRLLEELNQAHRQLQTISRHLVEVQETERKHLAGELHDEVGQALTGIKLTLELGVKSAKDPQVYTHEVQQMLSQLIQRVNDISLTLRPVMLDDFGLLSALLFAIDQYTKQTAIEVYFQHNGLEERRFSAEVETAAYRIIQEALTNVARYAGVNKVSVRLLYEEAQLLIEVEDHGVGFDMDSIRKKGFSYGIAGMMERAALLGGKLNIDSNLGAGTFLWAKLPI